MEYPTEHEMIEIYNPIFEENVKIDKGISELISLLWEVGLMTINSCQENKPGVMWITFPAFDAERFLNIICTKQFDSKGNFDSIYDGLSSWDSGPKWQFDAHVIDYSEVITEDDEIDYEGPPNLEFEISIRFPIKEYLNILKRVKKWKKEYSTLENYYKLTESD